jgi:hypothetical protein
MKKTMNDVYKYIVEHEGKKQEVSIAQIKEIVRIVVDMLLTEQDLGHALLVDYARNRKGKIMKKKRGKNGKVHVSTDSKLDE